MDKKERAMRTALAEWTGSYGTGADTDAIKRAVYKYTDCGAWIEIGRKGIELGSIVEGAPISTAVHCLTWPFTEDQYRQAIAEIEEEADQIWNEANGKLA